MKYFSILVLTIVISYGCAKKTVPATTATTTTTEATKSPDEIKIVTAVDPKNSKESIAGMETYTAKCGRCHGLKNTVNWTKEEWVPIMNSMAPKARLDSTQKANVLTYVQTHAKDA